MLRSRAVIRLRWAVACLTALAFTLASPAVAKNDKRPAPASSVTAPEPEKPFAGTARFFRIQDVLDKAAAGRTKDKRLAALGGTQTDALQLRGSIPLMGEEPFGLFGFRAPEGILWQKWRGVEKEFSAEIETLSRCHADEATCSNAARRFIAMVEAAKVSDGRARLEEVNRSVNAAIRYMTDAAQFGEADRWMTPLAAFASGNGDCEDYAIAKYLVLREAGFPLIDLRLVLVRDRAVRDDHAILAARHDGRWLILDNRHFTLNDDMALPHFTPLFAINHDGVKLVAAPYVKGPAAEGGNITPAAWLEGDEFALRGTVVVDAGNGASGMMVLPLLM